MGPAYLIYGLRVSANSEIPGLAPCERSSPHYDVHITLGPFPPRIKRLTAVRSPTYYAAPTDTAKPDPHVTVSILESGPSTFLYFRYEYGVRFVVDRRGAHVWGEWDETLTKPDASLYLLGPILGFVLRLRGMTCLHASAVVVNGMAFALVGGSGAGKSTTGAAFAVAGLPIVTDDVLALQRKGNLFLGVPGYPKLRLWPDAVEHLEGSADNRPRLVPNWEKRYLDLTEPGFSFQRCPVPLKVIYFLGPRANAPSAPSVAPVSYASAVPLLAAHTYRSELLDTQMRRREFYDLGALVNSISVRKVMPHAEISMLSALCETILSDFERVANG